MNINNEIMSKEADDHAAKVFEERHKAFRVLYNTMMEIEGATEEEIFTILCRNLQMISSARSAAFASYDPGSESLTLEAVIGEGEGLVSGIEEKPQDTVHVSSHLIETLKKEQVIECIQHSMCLVALFPNTILQKINTKIEGKCYRLSCIRENELIALAMVQLYPGQKLKMRDMVDTYLNMAGTIIQRLYAARALKESEERFRNIFKNAVIGMYRTTPDGRILMANPALIQMLGYSSFEELGQINVEKSGYDPENPRSIFKEKIEKDGRIIGLEAVWRKQDGTKLFIRESAIAIRDASGKTLYYEGTVEDITAHKMAEEQIKASLREKEVLLKEIHHRVKNNLSVISSLLNLQSKKIKDPQDLELFRESQNRVRFMALIHEKLYKSKDLARVDIRDYVTTLGTTLFHSYGVNPERIFLEIKMKDVALSVDLAIPCGLIINELVSNSLKYAFPPTFEGKGRITISLNSLKDNNIELIVKDNGIGIPRDLEIGKTESLGLRLVSMLAEDQLQGQLTINRAKGTEFKIRFKSDENSSVIQEGDL